MQNLLKINRIAPYKLKINQLKIFLNQNFADFFEVREFELFEVWRSMKFIQSFKVKV